MPGRKPLAEILAPIISSIKIEDLPGDVRWIAESLGVETTVRLILEFSGICLYIPKSAKRLLLQRYVQLAYDGTNTKRLAVELDVSDNTIQRWAHHAKAQRTHTQLDLFVSSDRDTK